MTTEIITIETPGLGDRSYLAHDGNCALVVDPQRDIDRVLSLAERHGVVISHVFETHVHNDYVSGGLALCRRTDATLVAPAGSGLSFDWHAVVDGDELSIGSMRMRVVHTPGHTHDHVSYVLSDAGGDVAVFTGGSLLYGTVGRTDLLGPKETDELTRAQWASARRLVADLGPDVTVHPTHGFGSFCSSQGGADRDFGTIGDEADDNPALRIDDVDEFKQYLLDGLSDHPAYYAHMAHLNRAGAGEPDLTPPAQLDADTLRQRLESGDWVLDLRDRRAYAEGHLVGTAGFEIDGPFVTYVGWLIPWGSGITLIAEKPEDVARAQRELVRIGIERPAGAATGPVERLAGDHPTQCYQVATFEDLANEASTAGDGEQTAIVDVRRAEEWQDGHIQGSVNIPIHQLLEHVHHVPAGRLWVHCASGARAAISASLLARAGHDVVLIDDQFDNASEAGLSIVSAGAEESPTGG